MTKCKNCECPIIIQGKDIAHPVDNGGIAKKCLCGCEKPERKQKAVFCSNCGNEIRRKIGEWHHVVIDHFTAGGISLRVGYQKRRMEKDYYNSLTGQRCTRPEPEKEEK